MVERIWLVLPLMIAPAPALAGEVFGGVFVHDVETRITRSGQEGGIDIHAGWRGERLRGLGAIGAPSPHVFAQVNTAGDTSFAGFGIGWKISQDRLYIRPGIGLAVHNGPSRRTATPDRIDFGSRIVFVPELSVGVQVDERWSVEASWIHLSHAQIFSRHNPGSDNFGLRVNYRFR